MKQGPVYKWPQKIAFWSLDYKIVITAKLENPAKVGCHVKIQREFKAFT